MQSIDPDGYETSRRVRMKKKNDNLQQQRQQKATQTLVVQNMDSAILGGLNHHPEDKY